MASELKIASAFVLLSRWSISCSLESGLPKRTERTLARARPVAVLGADAAFRATSWPGPA